MINLDDVQDGIKELERAARVGLSGAMITEFPLEHRRYDGSEINLPTDEAPFRGEAGPAQVGRRPQFFALHSFHHALGQGLGNQIVVEEFENGGFDTVDFLNGLAFLLRIEPTIRRIKH